MQVNPRRRGGRSKPPSKEITGEPIGERTRCGDSPLVRSVDQFGLGAFAQLFDRGSEVLERAVDELAVNLLDLAEHGGIAAAEVSCEEGIERPLHLGGEQVELRAARHQRADAGSPRGASLLNDLDQTGAHVQDLRERLAQLLLDIDLGSRHQASGVRFWRDPAMMEVSAMMSRSRSPERVAICPRRSVTSAS